MIRMQSSAVCKIPTISSAIFLEYSTLSCWGFSLRIVIGGVVGGAIGGIVGYAVGEKNAQTIYQGAKKVAKAAASFISNGIKKLKDSCQGAKARISAKSKVYAV